MSHKVRSDMGASSETARNPMHLSPIVLRPSTCDPLGRYPTYPELPIVTIHPLARRWLLASSSLLAPLCTVPDELDQLWEDAQCDKITTAGYWITHVINFIPEQPLARYTIHQLCEETWFRNNSAFAFGSWSVSKYRSCRTKRRGRW